MRGVRFHRAELDYGCHAGRVFEFPSAGVPAVVFGPNGSGKSTLLEALVRVLFGFNRRHARDRARLERRRPWAADGCRAALVLVDGDGARWRIDRSFADARVRIERLDPPGDAWEGEGNPAAGNQDAREYRRRLSAIIGFADIEPYVSTACIEQGALRATRPGDHLLQLATGGHRDVERAREKLKQAHRELTSRAIAPGDSAAHKARRLEELEQQVRDAQEALQRAEAAEAARAPLLREREQAATRAAEIEAQIGLLEGAQGPLAELDALEAKQQAARARLGALERAERSLHDALVEHADADAAWREFAAKPLYPSDFPERLARLDPLWRQRDVLRTMYDEGEAALRAARPPAVAKLGVVALIVLVAAGAGLLVTGRAVAGLILLLAGAATFIAALLARRRAAERHEALAQQVAGLRKQMTDTAAEIARALEGIPDADTLTAATAPDRRVRFDRQRDALQRVRRAAERLRAALDAASAAASEDVGATDAERAGGMLSDVAWRVLERIRVMADAVRRELAELSFRLEQAGAMAIRLPDGVPAEHAAILDALAERRAELHALRARVSELDRRLLELATAPESAVAIRDRLQALEAERAEVEVAAAAYAAAYVLLGDAYAEFRHRDQERLVGLISTRLLGITRARLGPLEVGGPLADARVRAFGRSVPIESPPLSYGERHAAALAIRMGAADFLAVNGIVPPLLVDEPFAYLDPEHAAYAWELLLRIAEDRQVIVATQDRLVLEHLGVEPAVVLGG
ncbi:MAG TPA: AAA family ATPase [Longimicrobiales bacterium]